MDRLYAMRFVDWILHPYPITSASSSSSVV
jgi:hypothetical protein